jgi:RNA 2',3'-cyclic 3'-phosphodiesterase
MEASHIRSSHGISWPAGLESESMRLFLAIELGEPVRKHLLRVQQQLRRETEASWARAENLHLTLKFLGEVEPARLPSLCAAMADAALDRSIQLHAAALECFPARGPVRVIAAAVAGEVQRLVELQQSVERACAELGFATEQRQYRPHVTLARARRPLAAALRGQLAEAAAGLWPGPEMEAGQFVLMESRPASRGMEYVPLARFPQERA